MVPNFNILLASATVLAGFANAQNPDGQPDRGRCLELLANSEHPPITVYKCTTAYGCTAEQRSVVIEWTYHWIHTAYFEACTTASGVDPTLCPDEETCAKNCFIQGDTNYTANGVTTSEDALTMYQYTTNNGQPQSSSPRLYLRGADDNYEMLRLLGQELTFTVDLSALPCGENGALYLSEMDKTGGRNQYNTGGANYGSGYCDAQCPVQTWKNGTLNTDNSGYCCNEMDILEGNSQSHALTPHPCTEESGCDKSGCSYNPYGSGFKDYFGPGKTVDTSKPVTIITQFNTDDGTTTGTLTSITRKYMQDGQVLPSANPNGDIISTEGCSVSAKWGGLETMGEALGRGMVLTFSIWNDAGQFMNWLDSGNAGPCSATEGDPSKIIQEHPDTHVVFSNIRWGDIGSTF
ncbi:concanavalin A-like lectin/glucanase domain-containing protein [Xylaria nigripes]|nr:concanavalin A-like lectin/glucanase domain-containing protein [Xylaria nigripes]